MLFFSLKFRMVNSLSHLLLLFQHYQNLIQVFHHHLYRFLKICIKIGLYNGHFFNKYNKLLLIKINFINHLIINKNHLQILYHPHHHHHLIILILNNKIIIIIWIWIPQHRNGNHQVRISKIDKAIFLFFFNV